VNDEEGFFVEPTVIETKDPDFRLLRDELFGPVVTGTSIRRASGATRSSSSTGRRHMGSPAPCSRTIETPSRRPGTPPLRRGNFYVNDSRPAAVVGQQPFGGGRASGTNDKAGSMWNLIRWVSPRTIKETFVPPTDYRYPFMAPDTDGSGSKT